MVSNRYTSFKFTYVDDLGRTLIKRARGFFKEQDGQTIYTTPITPLFLSVVSDSAVQVDGTSQGLRRLETFVNIDNNEASRQVKLPFAPGDNRLEQHITEVFNYPGFICAEYRGDDSITGGINNGG